jgi:hypothetical protein
VILDVNAVEVRTEKPQEHYFHAASHLAKRHYDTDAKTGTVTSRIC